MARTQHQTQHRTQHRALALLTTPLALGMAVWMAVWMAVALAASPAQASSTTKKDPRGDAFSGTATSLDLAGVTLRTKGPQRIQVTFRLHNPATVDSLTFPGGMAVEFFRNKKTLRSVKITAVDGALKADVCSYDLRKDVPPPTDCRAVPFTQVDDSTFRAEVRRKQIKKGAKVLEWYASVFDTTVSPFSIDVLGRGASKPLRWRL